LSADEAADAGPSETPSRRTQPSEGDFMIAETCPCVPTRVSLRDNERSGWSRRYPRVTPWFRVSRLSAMMDTMADLPTPGAGANPPGRPAGSPREVQEQLAAAGYLADASTGTVVHLAAALGKPVLVEGPAGTGKTQLAKSVALMTGKRLIRLQCYEGLDESKAIYEWDYRRQLLQLQLHQNGAGQDLRAAGIFGADFLLSRPLLAAIRSEEPVVLLIDEVDRLDMEAEALLLEVLSEYQVSIPELGTLTALHIPQVYLTSNNTRDLSEALKRRCLYLHLGYPSTEREAEIVRLHVPELSEHLAAEIAGLVAVLRTADLKKPPSISETVDWARTLLALGAAELTDELTGQTLSVLLKYERDITVARTELSLAADRAG
jgi:MoxR-like ATPase